MDYWFIAYIVICVCIGGGLVAYMYNRGQNIGAMILLVLLIAVYAFFGLRWFSGTTLKGTTPAGAGGAWPPVINLCPDFMTAVKAGTTANVTPGNDMYCIDSNNVYDIELDPVTTGIFVNVYTSATATPKKGIKIGTYDTTTKKYTSPLKALTDITGISTGPNVKNIRWEGVWDGRTFNGAAIPIPS
jgi:hypothetical protein